MGVPIGSSNFTIMLHATLDILLWVLLELSNCAPTSMQAFLWLPHKLRPFDPKPFNGAFYENMGLGSVLKQPYASIPAPPAHYQESFFFPIEAETTLCVLMVGFQQFYIQ